MVHELEQATSPVHSRDLKLTKSKNKRAGSGGRLVQDKATLSSCKALRPENRLSGKLLISTLLMMYKDCSLDRPENRPIGMLVSRGMLLIYNSDSEVRPEKRVE